MVEVARGEVSGPLPVVCLVAEQRDERGEDETNDESGAEHAGHHLPASASRREVAHRGQAMLRRRRPRQLLVRRQTSTTPQVHTSQMMRSSTESVVNMPQTTIGRVSVSSRALPTFSSPRIRRYGT